MGYGSEVTIGLRATSFGRIASRPDCASNKNLTRTDFAASMGNSDRVRRDRNFHSADIQRLGRKARRLIIGIPDIQLIRCSLEGLNHIDAALRVVSHQRAITSVVSAFLQFHD